MQQGHCDYALLPGGWATDVRLTVGDDGCWHAIETGVARGDCPSWGRYVIPGMPNLHSHAFQRAMAGSAERFERPDDSFWSWREAMYRHAGRIDPDSLHAIACWLYAEMVEQGYTRVCEFHYVHHQADGTRHAPPSAMSQALLAAAREVGIGLTLLLTLYQRGGFRDEALNARQRRFHCDSDEFMALCATLEGELDGARLGAAMHSLRAVDGVQLRRVLEDAFWRDRPLHVHVAEQLREVEECLALHGRRPIQRLFDLVAVDRRYCLVHATHADAGELAEIARAGAAVGICTTTEANLGDGLFPLTRLRELGGVWGIGSDSHIGLDPREELRWLEYQARLNSGRRTVLGDSRRPDVAANLWLEAVGGGAQASGARGAGFVPGADADWVALDHDDPALADCTPAALMGTYLFAPARRAPARVGVAGRVIAVGGRHPRHDALAAAYRAAVRRLGAAST